MADAQNPDSNAELAAALKQQTESNTRVETLLRASREQNLIQAKLFIKQHGFTAKDLAPELKQKRAKKVGTVTPRKSPAARTAT
ncbi:MAG: hypothetical protein Q7U05_13635 [Polaromonas sp.]|nr:hypothetical protein [Polaromonas sp.]